MRIDARSPAFDEGCHRWRVKRRDWLAVAAAAALLCSGALRLLRTEDTVTLIGPLQELEVAVPLAGAAVLLGGLWAVARSFAYGELTGVLAAFGVSFLWLMAGLALFIVHDWVSSDTYQPLQVADSEHQHVLGVMDGFGDAWVVVYRGGPWRFREVSEWYGVTSDAADGIRGGECDVVARAHRVLLTCPTRLMEAPLAVPLRPD